MSYPPPPGGQPPSFKTNVNRAKTKRWVEAKSYSYDGDDWGDMDEYDEYGGYDDPPTPPKPTGLRQRGQSASQDQQAVYPPHQGAYSNPEPSQHGYGPIGRQGPPPQQYGARSATNPPSQNQLTRSGSFDQGDERRAFSATFSHQGGPPPQMERYQQDPYAHPPPTSAPNYPSRAPQGNQNQPGPPVPQSATNFQDLNLPRDQPYPPPPSHRPLPPSDNIQQPSMGSRTQSMTSNSSLDFHNRRDFSPSAVPPPLHTRGSPSPQNRSDPQLGIRPPRKSSLGQHGQPQQPYADQDAETSDEQDAEGRDGMPRGRTDSNTSKPLPFVRPADIYKRMQEEKERERQSQDSSRPSLDAIMGEPGKGDEPRKDPSGAPERSHDGETRQRSKSILDPVAERKSEYGMPGAPAQDAGSKAHTAERQAPTIEAPRGVEASKPSNILRAQLPDVARMSGFGELFAGTSDPLKNLSATSASEASGLSQSPSYQPGKDPVDTPLQHQPSLGFRSVVHQAFDPNEQIPETPSSSYADSSIGRSGSGGTSVVSPIISRGPSAATPYADFRDPPIRATTPPAVNENADNERRPESSGSLGTPKAIPRKASPDPASQRPGSFIPGHRRDLSTPSPDNSPARTPALEVNEKLQQPHKAEVAMTTPIETQFPSGHSQSESSHGSRTSLVHISDTSDFATTHPSRIGRAKADAATTETPKSPADSTKSKVRSLADKFESGRSSPAGSERAPSPVKTSFLPGQTTNQYRPPAADRLESFRPRLPGGWDSSASLAPLATSSRPEATSAPISLQQRLQDREPDVSKPTAAMRNPLGGSPSRDSDRNSPTAGPTKDEASITDPFASLAAAGSALAGAFSTAMGSDNDGADKDSPTRSTFETSLEPGPMAAEGARSMTRPRNTSVNTAFIPEASKPMMLSTPDDEASSIQPTPLDKLSQPARSGQSQAVDYFAASPKPTQQASGDSYTSQDTASTKRLQLLPSISTDNGSQYESDRLRREIIRELSPRLTSEPSTAESGSQPRDAARQSTNPNSMPDRHESMVLPREYDSYWNHSGSEHSSRASSVQAPSKAVRDAMSQYNQGQTTMSPVPETASQPPTIGVEAQPVQDQLGERPEMPAHRFSWEVTNEITPPVKATLPPELPSSDNKFGDGSLSTPQGQLSTGSVAHAGQRPQGAPSLDSGPGNVEGPSQTAPSDRLLEPSGMRQAYDSQEAGFPAEPEPISTLGQSAYTDVPEPAMHESELAGTRSDVYADQDLHPHQLGSEDMLQPLESTPDVQPLPAIPSAQPKIQSFREILALKEPRDRISAYNHTREQYANSDTGLDHWLALTTANLPEHSELLPNGRLLGPADYKPPTARSKLGGLLPTGSSSAQQPYYQQYLNASAPAGSTTANQVPGGSPNQGYSPSSGSGKLSSQQMQAKGKDLLHSAGVFGGKANVAAKGLFSKGKSKFRGGNADKV